MYYYIVNPSSGDRSFSTIQNRLKTKLHELGIDGEFAKTLETGDAAKMAEKALRQGATTIVVAGGDKTVNEVLAAVHSSPHSATPIGIIPLGKNNTLARYIGIKDWLHACDLLAGRRLHKFQLVHLNQYTFIHSCTLTSQDQQERWEFLAEINGEYRVRGQLSSCEISNVQLHNQNLSPSLLIQVHHSQDTPKWWQRLSRREPYPSTQHSSQLHARVVSLELSGPANALVDGRAVTDTRFHIRLSDQPIRLITARLLQQGFDA